MSETESQAPTAPERPALTLPEAEAAWLREAYEAAGVILEYGSGGSTVMAAEMDGKTVTSVENDPAWADMMEAWFAANPPASLPRIARVDVGEVKEWGKPANNARHFAYPGYALGVWGGKAFVQPDLVLIDGRFRVGCLLACVFRSRRPVQVMFDDYVDRPEYHVVEDYAEKVEVRGRMARFEVTPRRIRNHELLRVAQLLQLKN
ncbi:hypothetical protein OG2516_03680 [Oceanicola granulosus HTCC2516]|uniref:Uncharacterized protein n=1 Tax=Oceanicola granulosus (strain ATCC BAA-861 / DSM 15982 / KCTC 12143 / HTCC2516) TaxID=314256 RepID=Q2CG75_OCEGH|nr:hypothetical protein [Oceanicola granulosus]EAR51654.1 hypothetical protein OG2516_03680 [Oceanicola granulosus HTCC2516]